MVVDSSSLISLARAGLLQCLGRAPVPVVLLDVVWREAVVEGRQHQHADAHAIESVLADSPRHEASPAPTVDHAVLHAAVADGVLLANDLALGRRARTLGARWLRTADLMILLAASARATKEEARAAIAALRAAGRITDALHDQYQEGLR